MEMSTLQPHRAYARPSQTPSGGSTLRVIIVEDSALIRARLSESLAEIANVEIVDQVETEAAALAAMRQSGWDAAVLDLQLKQGTGLGLLKALAQGARPPNTKIIVFTNYAFPQYRDRSLALGADYFFDKAREFHRVREVLQELAGGPTPATH
jgi:two-component system OmpR family response regulator